MDTDIDITNSILKNSLNRTGVNTFSALNAATFFDDNSTSGPIHKGSGGTDFSARSRITGKASVGDKAGGKAA